MLRTSHAPPSKENVKDVDPDFGQTIQRKCDLWTVQTSSQRWGVSSKRRVLQLRFFDVRFRTPGRAESGNLDRDAEALLDGNWHKEAPIRTLPTDVFAHAMRWTAAGILIGFLGSLAATRWLRRLLYYCRIRGRPVGVSWPKQTKF